MSAQPLRKPRTKPKFDPDTNLRCTVCGLRWPETEECRSPSDCNLVRETDHACVDSD